MLNDYNILTQIRPKSLRPEFPYAESVLKTMKQIELVYQKLTPTTAAYVRGDQPESGKTQKWKTKLGGGARPITVITG
jgi:hypothetical protein